MTARLYSRAYCVARHTEYVQGARWLRRHRPPTVVYANWRAAAADQLVLAAWWRAEAAR